MKYKSVLQHSEERKSEEEYGASAIARDAETLCLARLETLSTSTNYLSARSTSGVRVILYTFTT